MSSNVYTSDVTVDTASKAQLAESIRLRSARLSGNVDELVGRLHPKTLAAQAKATAKGLVINPDGSLKTEVAALGGGLTLAAVAVTSLVLLRKRRG
ncbi:DUF3618 domain-containing protein [Brevibacterium sp. 50QC2O2]|uniref:DUF3618 domain-containing protein n=1 Tax=Brevibacterium TaxID=1696 RepID=UPI00211BF7C3|nr:DUF3618 domain-containing protein [Brevibacterium sp. 91QC2O2]MCQ9386275.1 DUF3618 domain-containing protein [Brevibacterium sp. 68QC2CO]MCQ9388996.1 DUF3618 domain-containing protein [Brevibacterium sp. 50QC2O2]